MNRHVRLLDKYDCEIVEERYNPLIKRREIIINVFHGGEGTPSRGFLKKAVATLYGIDPGLVYIRSVKTEYGMGVSIARVHIYESAERARLFEPEYIIKRDDESLSKLTQVKTT